MSKILLLFVLATSVGITLFIATMQESHYRRQPLRVLLNVFVAIFITTSLISGLVYTGVFLVDGILGMAITLGGILLVFGVLFTMANRGHTSSMPPSAQENRDKAKIRRYL